MRRFFRRSPRRLAVDSIGVLVLGFVSLIFVLGAMIPQTNEQLRERCDRHGGITDHGQLYDGGAVISVTCKDGRQYTR